MLFRSEVSNSPDADLETLFGAEATITPLTSPERMGRRIDGVDLSGPLSPEQAQLLVALLDRHQVVCFPGQDRHGLDVHGLERLANHFGAPIPHPRNYANYGSGEELELLPVERRASTLNDEAFPGEIACWPGADSPAVYIVSNVAGGGPDVEPVIAGGQHWHTDIEFEPIPLSTSTRPSLVSASNTWATMLPASVQLPLPFTSRWLGGCIVQQLR